MGSGIFNEMELDAVGEIMNISLGASATAVSTMLGTTTNITTPVVDVENRNEFHFTDLEPAIGVEISYVEGLMGKNVMLFSRDDVRVIVGMMMGMEIAPEDFEMDEMNSSAIREIMNQMMGSSATALSEFLGYPVNISTPLSFEIKNENEFKDKYFTDGNEEVIVRFSLEIGDKLSSEFLFIMSIDLVKKLLEPYAETLRMADEPEPAPEVTVDLDGFDSNEPLDQNATDALLAKLKGEAPPEPQPEATDVISDEEALAKYQEMKGGKKTLTQDEADNILARLKAEVAAEENAGAAPAPTVPPTAAPIVPPTAAPQPSAAAAIPQGMPVQPQMAAGQPVYMQPQTDPVLTQLLVSMQQSQAQMMELLSQMREERQTPVRHSEPAEKKNSLVRSMKSPEYADIPMTGDELDENRDMLMKVPLEISVEIGRTKKPFKDILELTQGSLVVLDKMAGEQADLYVNGECIAHGDIVVVEDNFGIRITEILNKDIYREEI